MNELSLFTGAGGGILGGKLLGWRCVCAVEINPFCRRVLCDRQDDGTFEPFPIWDDVKTFDGKPWHGIVDVISGGFPCQDISAAGKGDGIDGERSGLWSEMARIVSEVRPRFVFVENSPMLVSRGGSRVLGDLASLGYDAVWGVVGSHHVGASHKRDRLWILAYAYMPDGSDAVSIGSPQIMAKGTKSERSKGNGEASRCSGLLADPYSSRQPQPQRTVKDQRRRVGDVCSKVSDANGDGRCGLLREAGCGAEGPQLRANADWKSAGAARVGTSCKAFPDTDKFDDDFRGHGSGAEAGQQARAIQIGQRAVEPELGRVAHGVAHRSHRLKSIGNGQDPGVVALAWQILSEEL